MDKNSVIGFILIALILFGFTFFQGKRGQEAARIQAQQDSIEAALLAQADTTAAKDSIVSSAVASDLTPAVQDTARVYTNAKLEEAFRAQSDSVVTLENDKFVVEFSSRGAQPVSVRIKDYYNYDSTDLYIFKPDAAHYAVSVFTDQQISTDNFNFQVAQKSDTCVVFRLPFSDESFIEQKYSIKPDTYDVKNELSFINMAEEFKRPTSSFDIDFSMTVPRMEKGYKNETLYSKVDYCLDEDESPEEFGKGRAGSEDIRTQLSWFAFQQQFFSVIMRAPQKFDNGNLSVDFYSENDEERRLMDCKAEKMVCSFDPTQGDVTIPFEFYFGPNSFKGLKEYDHKYEKIIPLGGWLVGWFTRYVIIPLFDFFNRFISSFGLIILLMTIVIKLLVLPLTYKSLASSAKMAALKPEIEKINAKFTNKGDQQEQLKKQQATMNLYKRAGVSPMGGCLPTLLTFPILWAMFRFFPASIELRQQPFLWCHDLSAYDSIIDYGTHIPILGDHLSLFALLMAITMWAYSKFTMKSQPGAGDPTAKSMTFMTLWLMPIMMFFICNSVSAALSYYYFISQLIQIFLTWIVRKSINTEAMLEKVRATEGKPMPKSKWQLRLEQAQKMQEQQQRANSKKRK